MKTSRFLLALFISFSLLGIRFSTTRAIPPMPSSFYGTVLVNGANLPEGFPISAWINGVQYAIAYTAIYGGQSVYSISVPGDDTSTPAIEGGTDGQLITFKIDQLSAAQTATWHSATNVPLNLTFAGYSLEIISEHGMVQKNPNHTYFANGEMVELTALPDPGWDFIGWSGDLTGVENPASISINEYTSVTANYEMVGFWLFLPLINR